MSTQAGADMVACLIFIGIVAMVVQAVRWCRAHPEPTVCNRGDDCAQCRRDFDEHVASVQRLLRPAYLDDQPLTPDERTAWEDLRRRLNREPEEH